MDIVAGSASAAAYHIIFVIKHKRKQFESFRMTTATLFYRRIQLQVTTYKSKDQSSSKVE